MTWFLTPEPRVTAGVRLFCIPYAGGGAAVYREWGRVVDESIEVRAVQLPGRGWRLREPPETDMEVLACGIADAIQELDDRPFALFGHSMGSWMALEVTRELERRGRSPVVLFASGRQAPSMGSTRPPLSHLDDDAFVAEIQETYGGIPPQILGDPDILDLLLPSLRADIAVLEGYRHRPGAPVACPLVALAGEDDDVVDPAELPRWADETEDSFELRTFPGGHFYFQPRFESLLRYLEERIEDAAGALRGEP